MWNFVVVVFLMMWSHTTAEGSDGAQKKLCAIFFRCYIICHWHDMILEYNDFFRWFKHHTRIRWVQNAEITTFRMCGVVLLLGGSFYRSPCRRHHHHDFLLFFVIFALSSAQFFCLFAIEHPWNIFVFNLNSDKNDIIIESLTRSLSLCVYV